MPNQNWAFTGRNRQQRQKRSGSRRQQSAEGVCILRRETHTATMQAILMVLGLLTANIGHAEAFPGGHEALIAVATEWIATNQSIEQYQVEITPPDRRIPIDSCEEVLSIRFPFINNRKTIEVSCQTPLWKRYLRVKIEETADAWVFTQDLAEGTLVLDHHIENITVARGLSNQSLKKIDIIGRVISRNIALGDIVTTDLLRNEITIYLTNRAYEAGEMIRLEDLGLETYTEESLTNPLTVWPEQTVIATNPLKPGELIRADDVEVAQYVLVAKSTIVNGQVATADLVESRLESVNAYGAQPLTNVNEILGLEATRTIRAGQRLNASDFIAADLVRKNETVRLTIKRGALEITVEAIALENAKIGEQVLLKNPDSGKEIRGIVTGRHAARGL